ncbi:MAG: LEPR-XLL domain-containing protein, partial [Planctomycetota bacterium]
MVHSSNLEALEPRLLLSADVDIVSCLPLSPSSDSVISLRYDLPAPEVEQVTQAETVTYDSVLLGGAQVVGDVGEPLLPVVVARVALPRGQDVAGVDVIAGDMQSLAGTYSLELGVEAVPMGADGADLSGLSPHLSPDYQYAPFEVAGVQTQRGVNVLTVRLNPVQWDSVSGALSYFDSMTLTVELAPQSAADMADQLPYFASSVSPLADQVDNPDALASYGAGFAPGD